MTELNEMKPKNDSSEIRASASPFSFSAMSLVISRSFARKSALREIRVSIYAASPLAM